MERVKFNGKDFLAASLWSAIWVGISELARYFLLVRPVQIEYFADIIPEMGEMSQPVTLIGWTIFSLILIAMFTFIFWLCANVYGNNAKAVWVSGVTSWTMFFVLLWIALPTMHLSSWDIVPMVLPLALLETVVASYICSKVYAKRGLK
ncbi:MAG: hypothetical protein SNJ29_12540 [Rikenellaceae bacterium]